MNILFLSYWGIEDGLTAATVIPHLRILGGINSVDKVFYFSIERENFKNEKVKLPGKIVHIPWKSGKGVISKILDFTRLPTLIIKTIVTNKIDLLICRGTPAGSIGYLVHCRTRIPYIVESVEPHSLYMLESGVWSRWGLSYNLQRYWERRQFETASLLLPVATNMVSLLSEMGIPRSKIKVMPCAVSIKEFSYSEDDRTRVRKQLQFEDGDTVGIYVGKFGGLYYDKEAFEIFQLAKRVLDDFKLIILTPDDSYKIESKLLTKGFSKSDFIVRFTDYHEVPAFLSASDVAFAVYKQSPSKKYLSPIKVGEYWANGLSVLITEGTGDESEIIKENGVGANFSIKAGHLRQSLLEIKGILQSDRSIMREKIVKLAIRYRNFDLNKEIYNEIVDSFNSK